MSTPRIVGTGNRHSQCCRLPLPAQAGQLRVAARKARAHALTPHDKHVRLTCSVFLSLSLRPACCSLNAHGGDIGERIAPSCRMLLVWFGHVVDSVIGPQMARKLVPRRYEPRARLAANPPNRFAPLSPLPLVKGWAQSGSPGRRSGRRKGQREPAPVGLWESSRGDATRESRAAGTATQNCSRAGRRLCQPGPRRRERGAARCSSDAPGSQWPNFSCRLKHGGLLGSHSALLLLYSLSPGAHLLRVKVGAIQEHAVAETHPRRRPF